MGNRVKTGLWEKVAAAITASPQLSNVVIAEELRVSDRTVGLVRKELEASGKIPAFERRVGSDGRLRPGRHVRAKPSQQAAPTRRKVTPNFPLWRDAARKLLSALEAESLDGMTKLDATTTASVIQEAAAWMRSK